MIQVWRAAYVSIWLKQPTTRMSNYLVSWAVTYLEDLQPTYLWVIIYKLSTMDILVVINEKDVTISCRNMLKE